jgi:hypothetical protein
MMGTWAVRPARPACALALVWALCQGVLVWRINWGTGPTSGLACVPFLTAVAAAGVVAAMLAAVVRTRNIGVVAISGLGGALLLVCLPLVDGQWTVHDDAGDVARSTGHVPSTWSIRITEYLGSTSYGSSTPRGSARTFAVDDAGNTVFDGVSARLGAADIAAFAATTARAGLFEFDRMDVPVARPCGTLVARAADPIWCGSDRLGLHVRTLMRTEMTDWVEAIVVADGRSRTITETFGDGLFFIRPNRVPAPVEAGGLDAVRRHMALLVNHATP